jgi:hypothetical protein
MRKIFQCQPVKCSDDKEQISLNVSIRAHNQARLSENVRIHLSVTVDNEQAIRNSFSGQRSEGLNHHLLAPRRYIVDIPRKERLESFFVGHTFDDQESCSWSRS